MKNLVQYLVIVLFILSLAQAIFLINTSNDLANNNYIGGAATAGISICINNAPAVGEGTCLSDINQSTSIENNTYQCQLNFTDPDGDTVIWSNTEKPIQTGLRFELNATTGDLLIDGNQSSLGTYVTKFSVMDNSVCGSQSKNKTYTFTVHDVNDPPFQTANILSREISSGATISLLFLKDYFSDVDSYDAKLNYTGYGAAGMSLYINQSTSEVILTIPSDFCDQDNIYFMAKDSGNLTATSNMVTINSICFIPKKTAAAGGGGGSSSCSPQWNCRDWGNCLINGTRSRDCVDLHGCDPDNLKKTFWETCDYVPTCFDGIKNQDETEIDCGGSCPACFIEPTCFDGIKNQEELGVDCGGPCNACPVVKPTCFDGIKNQGELGVDCGGPCEVCQELQIPAVLSSQDNELVNLATRTGVALLVLSMLYLIFKKELKSLFAKLGWWLTRKQRKQILLSSRNKNLLLNNLLKIEKHLSLDANKEFFESNNKVVLLLLKQGRLFFAKALGLSVEFTQSDLKLKSERLLINENLKNIFLNFYKKMNFIETRKLHISKIHLLLILEEIKLLVFDTSKITKNDLLFSSREQIIKGNVLLKIIKYMHNAVLALQYGEVDKAKYRYLKALHLYDSLSDVKKERVYEDISTIYDFIKCLISWKK